MKLIIRDDDLSYFSDPQHLESLYSDIWDKIPIHFATIPKVGKVKGIIPPEFTNPKAFYPIRQNQALVAFLKEKIQEGKAFIWQHGFTHQNYGQKFELERTNGLQLQNDLKTGRDLLEKTFRVRVDTLVAPHDRFSKPAVQAAEQVGFMYLCRGLAPLPREIQWTNRKYLQTYLTLLKFYLNNGPHFRFPRVLDFGNHQEIYSYRLGMLNKKNLGGILDLHQDAVLCLTIHHQNLTLEQLEMLKTIIHEAA